MEELERRSDAGISWNSQSDKLLLKALQDLSGDIMADINKLELDLTALEKKARSLTVGAALASASFNELCQTQYIQQEVGQLLSPQRGDGISKRSAGRPIGTSNQPVNEKHKEALRLGILAFQDRKDDRQWKPLPHVFGSPEYLQDATFGIGSLATGSGEAYTLEVAEERRDDFVEEERPPSVGQSTEGAESEEEGQREIPIPDFKSMLEAALRGDFDDGLDEELAEELGTANHHIPYGSNEPSGNLREGSIGGHSSLDDPNERGGTLSQAHEHTSRKAGDGKLGGTVEEGEGSVSKMSEDPDRSPRSKGSSGDKSRAQMGSLEFAGGHGEDQLGHMEQAEVPRLHALLYNESDLFSDEETDSSS